MDHNCNMDRKHSTVIIALLGAILVVLLVGRTTAIEMAGGALLGLTIGGLIGWAISGLIDGARQLAEEAIRDKKAGQPWLYNWFLFPGMLGILVVVGIAGVIYWLDGGKSSLRDCLALVPLSWLPIFIFMAGWPVLWIEKLIGWLRSRRQGAASPDHVRD
jgi:hypothetical protein